MFTFNLKGKEYSLTYKLKALLYFEQISQSLESGNLLTNVVMFYSFILASNPDFNLTPDDFFDALDEEPTLIHRFNAFLADEQKKQALFLDEETNKGKKSKKKLASKKSTASV